MQVPVEPGRLGSFIFLTDANWYTVNEGQVVLGVPRGNVS